MKLRQTIFIAAATLCTVQAQAYTASVTAGPTSLVAGVTTETFQGAAVFARAGQWDIFNSSDAGVGLTGNGIYLASGISAQPQKGVVSANDKWASVAGGHAATMSFAAGTKYVGFLWGSVDDYNTVTFFDGANPIAAFTGGAGGLGLNQVPQGDGNQAVAQYFNFHSSSITSVEFRSGGNAFEIDNVSAVPEPETYALLVAGLVGIGFVVRRRTV